MVYIRDVYSWCIFMYYSYSDEEGKIFGATVESVTLPVPENWEVITPFNTEWVSDVVSD